MPRRLRNDPEYIFNVSGSLYYNPLSLARIALDTAFENITLAKIYAKTYGKLTNLQLTEAFALIICELPDER